MKKFLIPLYIFSLIICLISASLFFTVTVKPIKIIDKSNNYVTYINGMGINRLNDGTLVRILTMYNGQIFACKMDASKFVQLNDTLSIEIINYSNGEKIKKYVMKSIPTFNQDCH